MVGIALIVFPKLALGLSGFETGVAVMPQVRGEDDADGVPRARIHGTKRLLTVAALIMSAVLITSSFVTTLLIPQAEFQDGGKGQRPRARVPRAPVPRRRLRTLYDISTICILWFAGASAMAGLLNIVPRYLPRYGMAPHWAAAVRPLVLVFTAIAVIVTLVFQADVDAQAAPTRPACSCSSPRLRSR